MPPARLDAATDDAARQRTLGQDPAFGILASRVPAGATVLDVGAGTGAVGRFVAARGASVDGIEPDPERAALAAEGLRHVCTLPLDQAHTDAELRQAYDAVLLIDVVEHLADPLAGIRTAADFLGPDGRLFLFVPNSAHWSFRLKILRGDWRYARWGLFDETHLRFFDLRTADRLVRNTGLTVVERWYSDHHGRRLAALGIRLRPNLFAFHVLYELRRP